MFKSYFPFLIAILAIQVKGFSQSILTPGFTVPEYNNPGQFFCQPDGFNVSFKALNFNTGNIFFIQLSNETGDFSNPTIIGQLADTGTNFTPVVCVIPTNLTFGSQHRIRVKSTDPEIVSETNQHPFSLISGLPEGLSPDESGDNKWLAHIHYWSSSASTITDPIANNINFFNPTRYVGRFEVDSLSFNLNFGTTAPGRGSPPLQNFQGCTKSDFFSIRFKRTMHLDSGYYSFKVSGDDGFRLSIDGGTTWIIRNWREQTLTTACYNNCCGIFVPGGVKNLVLEYFEKKELSSCALTIVKAGPPGIINDPNGLDGSSVCVNKNPFLLSLTPFGGIYSGLGVSQSGYFSPNIGGLGPRVISYQTGITPCLRTKNITINVLPGPIAQISGLDSIYCVSEGPKSITVSPVGGNLIGPTGLVGNTFDPSVAGVGLHTIQYIVPDNIGSCPDTAFWVVRVKPGIPISIQVSDSVVCQNGSDISLTGTPTGGIFEGIGVQGNSFNPQGLTPGLYQLQYRVIGSVSCGDSIKTFYIRVKKSPDPGITNLPTSICANGLPISLIPVQSGGIFSGPGISGSTFNPQIVPDSSQIHINYNIELEGCKDSSSQIILLERPVAPIVSLSGINPTYCSSDPTFTILAQPSGGILYSNGNVINSTIDPGAAGAGNFQLIYAFKPASSCLDTVRASGSFSIISTPVISGLQDKTIIRGTSIQLNASGAYTYQWTPTSGLDNSNISNPLATPTETTTYMVDGKDSTGFCTGKGMVTITVEDPVIYDPLFIPTLLTLNNDGKNESWVILGLKTRPLKKIEVFDRWGRKVFDDSNYNTPWDGKINGKFQSGTYFYIIDFEKDEDVKGVLNIFTNN